MSAARKDRAADILEAGAYVRVDERLFWVVGMDLGRVVVEDCLTLQWSTASIVEWLAEGELVRISLDRGMSGA